MIENMAAAESRQCKSTKLKQWLLIKQNPMIPCTTYFLIYDSLLLILISILELSPGLTCFLPEIVEPHTIVYLIVSRFYSLIN